MVLLNIPMILYFGGLTRALALPHLIWLILVPMIIHRLFFDQSSIPATASEFVFGLGVVAANGFSLLFDVVDSAKWFGGEREVLGLK